jgi:Tol biopolymer transport system component
MRTCRPALLVACVTMLVVLAGVVIGCGGNPMRPPAATTTIAFESSRPVDGSGTVLNVSGNVWTIQSDGTGATPLTRLANVASSDAELTWSADGSRIAFISSRALDGSNAANANGTFNLWVMKADGTGALPLTRYTTGAGQGILDPAWSPDGRKIAFDSDRALDGSDSANVNRTRNVWVVNIDGTGIRPLTRYVANTGGAALPAWSRDSSKVAFTSSGALDGSDISRAFNIWTINPDGSGATPLTKFTASSNIQASFSPDGAKIAFISNRPLDGSDASMPVTNIWVARADGSEAIPLTKHTAAGADVGQFFTVWSPDGKKIAFPSTAALDGSDSANPNSTTNVWLANTDGSGATPLTRLTYPGTAAGAFPYGWSPDGANLVFTSDGAVDGSDVRAITNIWVMKADGSNARPLTTDGNSWPAWKP